MVCSTHNSGGVGLRPQLDRLDSVAAVEGRVDGPQNLLG
jgi:hypothetical protein